MLETLIPIKILFLFLVGVAVFIFAGQLLIALWCACVLACVKFGQWVAGIFRNIKP